MIRFEKKTEPATKATDEKGADKIGGAAAVKNKKSAAETGQSPAPAKDDDRLI